MSRKCLVRPIDQACDACKIGHKELGTKPICKTCQHVKIADLISVDPITGTGKVVMDEFEETRYYNVGLHRIFEVEE